MTASETEELVKAALAAADQFREGDTPESPEIRALVRAADAYEQARPRPGSVPYWEGQR